MPRARCGACAAETAGSAPPQARPTRPIPFTLGCSVGNFRTSAHTSSVTLQQRRLPNPRQSTNIGSAPPGMQGKCCKIRRPNWAARAAQAQRRVGVVMGGGAATRRFWSGCKRTKTVAGRSVMFCHIVLALVVWAVVTVVAFCVIQHYRSKRSSLWGGAFFLAGAIVAVVLVPPFLGIQESCSTYICARNERMAHALVTFFIISWGAFGANFLSACISHVEPNSSSGRRAARAADSDVSG